MRFEFRAYEQFDDGDYTETSKTFDAITWDDALMRFQEFLLGCGFIFNGELQLVQDNEESVKPNFGDRPF